MQQSYAHIAGVSERHSGIGNRLGLRKVCDVEDFQAIAIREALINLIFYGALLALLLLHDRGFISFDVFNVATETLGIPLEPSA